MTIVCDCTACPYNRGRFCRNRLVKITKQGFCKRLSMRNWREPVQQKFMEGYRKCQQESQDIDQKDQDLIGLQQKDGQQENQKNIKQEEKESV